MPTSPHQYRFRVRFANGRDVEDAVPYNSFRSMMSEWPGGRGRPPLQYVYWYVWWKAGRIISAPTFTHTFCKRTGRRGRRPLQFVLADDVRSSGRPRAASPTGRFQSCCPNGRADNIRPYISAYIVPKAGTSRAASPTIRSGRSRKKAASLGRRLCFTGD